ncbi:hypothetical protein PanWU01x14_255780 [Parasponia andersonii]|uniref:Uncharacterized protein n=1 Tax=Parasponia andersonii TaxID=3476 RepID=A0A2P5BAW5_PARAD|nr:hypothetical protein PanWU01x14_255780 [Parasponia andersonii]
MLTTLVHRCDSDRTLASEFQCSKLPITVYSICIFVGYKNFSGGSCHHHVRIGCDRFVFAVNQSARSSSGGRITAGSRDL